MPPAFCIWAWVLILAAVVTPEAAWSQTAGADAAIEQSRLFQATTGLREPGYENYETEAAPATPGDPDLGVQQILRRKDDYDPFRIYGSTELFFTDNVGLVKDGAQDDAYFVGQVGATWAPRITPTLFGQVNVGQQFFRYDEFDGLDFDSLNVGAGLLKYWPEAGGVSTGLRYNYNRLTDAERGKEFFRNHQAILTVGKTFAHTRNLFTFIDGTATFSFSDPYDAQRWEYGASGGVFGRITRAWDAQASYRIALNDYFAEGRDDLNQSIVLQTGYNFGEFVRLGAQTSFNFNNSTQPVFDYESIGTGGGLYLNVKF